MTSFDVRREKLVEIYDLAHGSVRKVTDNVLARRAFSAILFGLLALIAANALVFGALHTNPLPTEDSWYFIRSILFPYYEGSLRFIDLFAHRGGGDYSQPIHRLLLLISAENFQLDFRFEFFVGYAALLLIPCLAAWALYVSNKHRGSNTIGVCALLIFAVTLSLSSLNIYTWSLVMLGYINTLFAFSILFLIFFVNRDGIAWRVVLALLFCAAALVMDSSAIVLFLSAALAIAMRDLPDYRRAALNIAAPAIGLILGVVALNAITSALSLPNTTAGLDIGGALKLILSSELLTILKAILSGTFVSYDLAEYLAPGNPDAYLVPFAFLAGALHIGFWVVYVFFTRFRRMPASQAALLHYAAAIMLFVYGLVAGMILTRTPIYGAGYMFQPRYAAVYQLAIIPVAFAFYAAVRGFNWRPARHSLTIVLTLLTAGTALLQLEASERAWAVGGYVNVFIKNQAEQMAVIDASPNLLPPGDCIHTVAPFCGLAPEERRRLIELMRAQDLSIYSDRFRRDHRLFVDIE